MKEFFAMNGYGLYVWSAYLSSGICLMVLYLLGARNLRKAKRQIARGQQHVT